MLRRDADALCTFDVMFISYIGLHKVNFHIASGKIHHLTFELKCHAEMGMVLRHGIKPYG